MANQYSELEVDRVLATLEALSQRIAERFPEAGLRGVCSELLDVGSSARAEIERNRQPIWPLRIVILALIAFMVGGVAIALVNVRVTSDTFHLTNLVDVVQNIIQDFVWLGIGLFFLLRAEDRVKRERVFGTLHKLRSIAHIVDMHQLTKDPYRICGAGVDTESSPKRTMSPFLLRRYLDYCSEMLSLTGKVAALYLRDFHDPVVVATVTEIEELSSGLSRKVWQKIASIPEDLEAAEEAA
jgi:hypothetical protein